ncbi:redoxin domain-containing protein [Haloterrigena salifodinae]|uniref:Redoxin domain-containing protein n=2 Tax=Haloterrigena salifodinae TaxID=2675099 RepID=A0A8T8E2W9_9EURY|nr:redoxin domain-containing protein [Haloterrigena salifodinae]
MTIGRDTIPRRNMLRVVGAGSIAALAGCAGTDDESNEESAPEPEAVDVSEDATWRTASLTDVTSGEEFRVEDAERPVIVHTFSTGCAVCRSQDREFDALYPNADVEIVDLTIYSNDDPETLRSYANEEGYEWRFGTATDEVTSDLISDFGREVTSSANSPVIVVCPSDGVYRLEKKVDAEHLESILADVCGPADSNGSDDSGDTSNSSDAGNSSDSDDSGDATDSDDSSA